MLELSGETATRVDMGAAAMAAASWGDDGYDDDNCGRGRLRTENFRRRLHSWEKMI